MRIGTRVLLEQALCVCVCVCVCVCIYIYIYIYIYIAILEIHTQIDEPERLMAIFFPKKKRKIAP
jgi:hypothetical protein